MRFADKMKTRRNIAVIYIALGLAVLAGTAAAKTENAFLSAFGPTLVIVGLARLRQYRRVTKNEETLRTQEVRETDERNVMLAHRARSLTFTLYVVLSSAAVILLSLLGRYEFARLIGYSVCLLAALYWICWFLLKKRY